jgi:hypothetical protein
VADAAFDLSKSCLICQDISLPVASTSVSQNPVHASLVLANQGAADNTAKSAGAHLIPPNNAIIEQQPLQT